MATEFDPELLYARYQRLQQYVNWTAEDAQRVRCCMAYVEPYFGALVDDFYDEIGRHPEAFAVITGGPQQIQRLKGKLRQWLTELFAGHYDQAYVTRRWRVGLRHVEIGLDQVYTNVALSRLRGGLLNALFDSWQGDLRESMRVRASLNKLLDLDLAIIEDAYQTEHLARRQRNERLVAIGQMAAGVAHELRNPLNVIKTSVYYVLNAKNATPEKQAEHLRRIERQVGLADKVITALSDFAKLPFPEVRPVALSTCLAEAVETASLPGNIELRVDLPPDLHPILGDPDQLRIVLGNLVRNARDAMAEGGQLTVRASQSGGFIQVEVIDTGAGIAREDLGRIMEPLYSTKTRGLGLGLAISRAIIDKHRGQLALESQPGKGTTFTVRFPAAVVLDR